MELPHELEMLPDDAIVQWGWVRRKLVPPEEDPAVEASMLYYEWLCTRNLCKDTDPLSPTSTAPPSGET